MKKIYSLAAFVFIGIAAQAQAAFWTEGFGNGCNRGQLGSAYTGTNGPWTEASTGTNDPYANIWFVSATAAGTSVGNCASSCLVASSQNQTLHIGNPAVALVNIGADTGSTYLTGTFCGLGICSVTNKRMQSPIINCSGQSNITASFLYYEGSEAADDATFVYSPDGGSTWSTLDPLAKTLNSTCTVPAGVWTSITVSLPASANNNTMVKIGFNWTNNGSGGTDPSCAFDDVMLTGGPSGIAATQVSELNLFASGNGQITITPNGQVYKMLAVFDMLGQEVRFTQVENNISLGNTTPGIYIVNLDVNGSRVVKKVVMN